MKRWECYNNHSFRKEQRMTSSDSGRGGIAGLEAERIAQISEHVNGCSYRYNYLGRVLRHMECLNTSLLSKLRQG